MAIIERLVFRPCDEGDPDDYRPNSSWALAVDPADPEGRFVRDLCVSVDVVAPGDRVPLHTHPIPEVIVVAEGTAEVTITRRRSAAVAADGRALPLRHP